MIPKRIFYVWGANEPKRRDVLACMQSWRQVCPGYEIIEINETSVEYFNFQRELESNLWFRTIYQKKLWAYMADYVRIKTLATNGGIYLDTDVSVLKNFDDFLADAAFVGMQDNAEDGKRDAVEPAILGAEVNNPLLKFLAKIYDKKIWKIPIFALPDLFAYALKELYGEELPPFGARADQQIIKLPDLNIYPEKFFIPFRFGEKFSPICVEPETYTIHWWSASWIKPEIMHFLKSERLAGESQQRKHSETNGYFRTFYLLGILQLKLFVKGDKEDCEVQIFGIPLLKAKKSTEDSPSQYSTIRELKLFRHIPLLRVMSKDNGCKKKYYLFGCLIAKSTAS